MASSLLCVIRGGGAARLRARHTNKAPQVAPASIKENLRGSNPVKHKGAGFRQKDRGPSSDYGIETRFLDYFYTAATTKQGR